MNPLEGRTTIVMVSCIERASERAQTTAQLEAIDLRPDFVALNACNDSDPATCEKQLRNARRCLEHALLVGGHVLFLEDDIDATPDLWTWVRISEYQPRMVTFTTMTRGQEPPAARVGARKRVPPELYRVPRSAWWGTQAFWIPEPHVGRLYEWTAGTTGSSFDTCILAYCQHFDLDIMAAVPNPVQHRNPPKMRRVRFDRDLTKRASRSFGRDATMPVRRVLEARRQSWRERTKRPTSP